jgi:hypothetical protein
VKEFTVEELVTIANEREQWAIAAHDKDLHGSAKEWEQTAAIARQLIRCMENKK